MKIVQRWLGHADYQTTANIYSSVMPDFERDCVQKIDTHFDTYSTQRNENHKKNRL